MRFSNLKLLVLAVFGLFTTSISYFIALNLAPTYFFDKLYYKKSPKYGYVSGQYPYIEESEKRQVRDRIEDLDLVYDKSPVLGTSSDEFKVVVIGDSFTFGVGIKNEDRYAVLLEKMLNDVRPTKVYSLAIGGDDMLEYYIHYKLAEEKIKPDLYVITMVNNDFLIHESNRPGLSNYLQDAIDVCGNNVKYEDVSERSFVWDYYLKEQVLPAASNKHSNSCIMRLTLEHYDMNKTVFLPLHQLPESMESIRKEKEKFKFGSPQEKVLLLKYKNLVKEAGGLIVDINYEKVPPDKLLVSEKEGHYSKTTNELIAKSLYTEIIGRPDWKFSESY